MEKELFISTLKEKAGVDNLSERTINEVATVFLPQFADDDKVTDESWTLPIQVLKSMSGQLRHDLSGGIASYKAQFESDNKAAQQKAIADAIAAAKAEWEKSGANKSDGTGDEKELDTKIANAVAKALGNITGDDGPLGKLSKQFSDFVAQVAADKKAQTIDSVRNEVRNYLLSRGVDEEDFALEYTLERLEIGETPDVQTLKAKAEKDYEANFKRIHKSDGGRPFNGGGGNGVQTNGASDWLKSRGKIVEEQAAAAEARRKLLK